MMLVVVMMRMMMMMMMMMMKEQEREEEDTHGDTTEQKMTSAIEKLINRMTAGHNKRACKGDERCTEVQSGLVQQLQHRCLQSCERVGKEDM
jgi:hypothetical protein